MEEEAAFTGKTKFSLVSPNGLLRLRSPEVSSSRDFLSVDTAGILTSDDNIVEVNGNSDAPIEFSVLYTCTSNGGWAEVTLLLEKVSLVQSSRSRPERYELKWQKFCGIIEYKHLTVRFKSEPHQTTTTAVESGVTKPSFQNPCRSPDGNRRTNCTAGEALLYEVPDMDGRTILELKITAPSAAQAPVFETPDVTFNHTMMRVSLPVSGQHLNTKKAKKTGLQSQTLTLRYTCFHDGISRVMLTLPIRGYKPVELAWKKRCVEPRIKVGKALTAPQAIMITLAVCLAIGLIAFAVFCCCGQDDKNAFSWDNLEEEDPLRDAIEMGSKRKVGRPSDEDEVVFH